MPVVFSFEAYSQSVSPGISTEDNTQFYELDPSNSLNDFTLLNKKHFSVEISHNSALGNILSAQYAHEINDNNALGYLVDFGVNELRLNLTFAHLFNENNAVLLTGEHLQQRLPFDFDSGTTDQTVKQNAIGAELKHAIDHYMIKQFDFKVYGIQSQGVNLSSITYTGDDGIDYFNQRHIAGGHVVGANAGTELSLTHTTLASFSVGGECSQYDLYYSQATTACDVTESFFITQALSKNSDIKLSTANNSAYRP